MLDTLLLAYVGLGPASLFFGHVRSLQSFLPSFPFRRRRRLPVCFRHASAGLLSPSPLPPPFLGTVANISIRSR